MKKLIVVVLFSMLVVFSQLHATSNDNNLKVIKQIKHIEKKVLKNDKKEMAKADKKLVKLMKKELGIINPLVSCRNTKKLVKYLIEKGANKGCSYLASEFEVGCVALTAGETGATSTIPCTVGTYAVTKSCIEFGAKKVIKHTKYIGEDMCDYMFPDENPYIVVSNDLKSHKVDFSVKVEGDNVHLRGDNWLKAERTSVLASHKLKKKNGNTVKVRIKRDGKKDIHRSIDGVLANEHKVYVYADENRKYHIKKKVLHSNKKYPAIKIENHLKHEKVDFKADINRSPDVHLKGNNWLKPSGKAILISYKLLLHNTYTVKARIKRKHKSDKHLSIAHVKAGKHKVYVYADNKGNYHIKKEIVSYK